MNRFFFRREAMQFSLSSFHSQKYVESVVEISEFCRSWFPFSHQDRSQWGTISVAAAVIAVVAAIIRQNTSQHQQQQQIPDSKPEEDSEVKTDKRNEKNAEFSDDEELPQQSKRKLPSTATAMGTATAPDTNGCAVILANPAKGLERETATEEATTVDESEVSLAEQNESSTEQEIDEVPQGSWHRHQHVTAATNNYVVPNYVIPNYVLENAK